MTYLLHLHYGLLSEHHRHFKNHIEILIKILILVTISIIGKCSLKFSRLLQSIIAQNTTLGNSTAIYCTDYDVSIQYSRGNVVISHQHISVLYNITVWPIIISETVLGTKNILQKKPQNGSISCKFHKKIIIVMTLLYKYLTQSIQKYLYFLPPLMVHK